MYGRGGYTNITYPVLLLSGANPQSTNIMSNKLFGKTLAECKNYLVTSVKENVNNKKYITINTEPGKQESAVNIYMSKRLSRKYMEGEYVNPMTVQIDKYVDEETGEEIPWLVSKSSYKSMDDILAMFS